MSRWKMLSKVSYHGGLGIVRPDAELDRGSEFGVPPGRNSSRAESPDILDLLTRLSAFPLGI